MRESQIPVVPKEHEPKTSLNIVVLPDEETTLRAIELSQRIAMQLPTEFVLHTSTYRPHMTLYQGYYPDRNLTQVTSTIRELAIKTRNFSVSLDSFQIMANTFLFWNCEKSDEIQQIHDTLREAINPFREGLIPPNAASLTHLTTTEMDAIKQTGGLLNGPRFHPHITITRVKAATDAPDALTMLQSSMQSVQFVAKSIALGSLGDHGTVADILEEFPLNGNERRT